MAKDLNTGQPSISFSKTGKSVTLNDGNGVKIRRMLKTITNNISYVHQKAVALSQKLSGQPKFPTDLGLDGDYPVIIATEVLDLIDMRRGVVSDDIPVITLIKDVLKIEKLARSNAAFEEAFYGHVGEHYLGEAARKVSTAKIKQALKLGTFQATAADVKKARSGNTLASADYGALKAWILDNEPQLNVNKIKRIQFQAELLDISQTIELGLSEELDPELFNKTKRRGEKASGHYFYGQLSTEQKRR